MKIIRHLFRKIKLARIMPQVKLLNDKYLVCVGENWKSLRYLRTIYCYPFNNSDAEKKWMKEGRAPFLKGLELALKYPKKQEIEIVLAWFDDKDVELIKTYVSLLGFDKSIVKSDWNT